MNVYENLSIAELLSSNTYAGRGIIAGLSPDGKNAVFAYFIMGRSVNSRNRIFDKTEDGIIIYPYDQSKVEDPSLIIYSPVRRYEKNIIVTNGDQTDTIYDYLSKGQSFEAALETRCFEPDSPNYTPRISALLSMQQAYSYKMSILKSADACGSACNRYTFNYSPIKGVGHFIHTYNCDGNPIPTFTGEPERVSTYDDINVFTDVLWDKLNENNKISLYVEYIDLETQKIQYKLLNKNSKED